MMFGAILLVLCGDFFYSLRTIKGFSVNFQFSVVFMVMYHSVRFSSFFFKKIHSAVHTSHFWENFLHAAGNFSLHFLALSKTLIENWMLDTSDFLLFSSCLFYFLGDFCNFILAIDMFILAHRFLISKNSFLFSDCSIFLHPISVLRSLYLLSHLRRT